MLFAPAISYAQQDAGNKSEERIYFFGRPPPVEEEKKKPAETPAPEATQTTPEAKKPGVSGEAAKEEEEAASTTEDSEMEEEAEEEEEEVVEEEGKEKKEKPKPVGPVDIKCDGVVVFDYSFLNSTDSYKIKYHFSLGGKANPPIGIIRGTAEISTEVTGFLAKWPGGECKPEVAIGKIPYELSLKWAEDEADIKIDFKKDIAELLKSTCNFKSPGSKPFITEGPPEKWLSDALGHASPPISSIAGAVEAGSSSSIQADIPQYTVIEENLGKANISGKIIITLQPAGAAEKAEE